MKELCKKNPSKPKVKEAILAEYRSFEADAQAIAKEAVAKFEEMKMVKKESVNCQACKHSYMEPDSDLICGLKGGFGKKIRKDGEHCDGGKEFEQHPLRNKDGTLKG